MKEIEHLKKLMHLKGVERVSEVGDRKESTAEHVYGCMIIAKHFLKKIDGLDEKKVMDLLLYHDLVELETGEYFILDEEHIANKKQEEKDGANILKEKIPETLREEYIDSFNEYEEQKTREAQFALAIDKIEAMIHWITQIPKSRRFGFTEKILREKKEKYMEPFLEIHKLFEKILKILLEEKYIDE